MVTAGRLRNVPHLLGMYEIAELAGVNRPVVHNWRNRHDDFPKPVVRLRMGEVYDRDDVLTYLRNHDHLKGT